jgi:hypothetical protein
MTEQIAEQGKILYNVSFRGETATFLWSPNPEGSLRSSVDLKVKKCVPEIKWLARNLGCSSDQERVLTSNFDSYNRLLIYACVRPTLKNAQKASDLAIIAMNITSWDALYWASRFREIWWRNENYRSLIKSTKAFRLFFGLE